ncbi:MAG: metal-dependent hydrolase, partial [Chrysiogenetes bacterium]|nr:metal-dependent hydrolase [Chrysiogenetes bacterium]
MNSGIELPRPKAGRQATRLPGGAAIDVRKMDFSEIEGSPLYAYAKDPLVSHFFHMLSLLFPEGELFFMDSVRNYKKEITDPVLKAQIKAFMSQEALHTKAHVAYNKRLEAAGINLERVDKVLHWAFAALKKLPRKDQLAITLVCEHFTSTIANELLRNEEIQSLIDDSHKNMWLWHAVEETEHKAVAFDVFRAVGGSEARRLWGVPLTVVGIGP